jgi:prepilin-type N-terminal cleavage/methylation domain-containing protein
MDLDTAMMTTGKHSSRKRIRESGFSLLEVMIAIAIMTIGMLALIASFAAALTATASAEEDLIARQKALEAMESIYTARNSLQIPFSEINNTSSGGIFVSGSTPLYCAGNDGIYGTADDAAGPCTAADTGAACPGNIQCLVLPGPDGILGTADDITQTLSNFSRTITFTPVLLSTGVVNTNLIAVSVSVTYQKPGYPIRTYTVNGLISSYH